MPREIVLKQDYDRMESLNLEIQKEFAEKILYCVKKIKKLEERVKVLENA